MKVLVLTPNFPPSVGGIEDLLWNVVSRWQKVDVTVLTPRSPGAEEHDAEASIEIRRTRRIGGQRLTIAWLNAAAVIFGVRLRPDVVLSGHLVTSPGAWVVSRRTRARVIQYVYGREIPRRRRLARFAFRMADRTVAISKYTEDLSRAVSPSAALIRVTPGIELPAGERMRRGAVPTIVSVARLVERSKGHDVLLSSFALVLAQVCNARLSIVGDGPLRGELEQLASQLGITHAVDFTGLVSNAERDRLLSEAWVFALPTREDPDGGGEGFGIVFLEAAARGLPVVAGSGGGVADAVVDGETGVIVDPHDIRSVADALIRLLEERDEADRLGSAGARRATGFGWETVATKVEEAVLELASAGSKLEPCKLHSP